MKEHGSVNFQTMLLNIDRVEYREGKVKIYQLKE